LILSNPFKENPSGKDRSCLLSVQFVIIVAVVVIVVIPLALPPLSSPSPIEKRCPPGLSLVEQPRWFVKVGLRGGKAISQFASR